MLEVLAGISAGSLKIEVEKLIQKLMEKEQVSKDKAESVYEWLGRVVRLGGVGGIEGSNLARVFVLVCRLEEANRGDFK